MCMPNAEDIGDLEKYVQATSVMLLFLSKKYFSSRNCLKEVKASVEKDKPIILVQEQQEDKGGAPFETLQAECRDDELRGSVFNGRTPIVWHRIRHFQNLSLKLIATEMLRNGPTYSSTFSELTASNAPEDITLILPGEVDVSELSMPQPLIIWCSTSNPGATEVAEELVISMAKNGAAVSVVHSYPELELEANTEPVVMLLYLNKDTWVEQGDILERDVRAARESSTRLKVLMVHENDKDKGGCKFDTFFGTTPQEMINGGIYRSARSLNRIFFCCLRLTM